MFWSCRDLFDGSREPPTVKGVSELVESWRIFIFDRIDRQNVIKKLDEEVTQWKLN